MIEYLQSPQRAVWDLADEGDAFVWIDDGSTIALAPELAAILAPLRISLDGLPSLTATLFVIAGLRPTSLDQESNNERWRSRLSLIGGRLAHGDAVAKWLSGLSQLPEHLRGGVEGPITILGCGMEHCRRFLIEADLEASDEIIEVLEIPGHLREQYGVDADVSSLRSRQSPRTQRAWETLLFLKSTWLDAEALQTWKETGLLRLPEPIEEIEPPPLRNPIDRLLSELADDDKLGGIAHLSRTTASLLTLPRRPSDPDLLPLGGVSDVTNRGNPERLLMTELAADPMLLLARIANGQALYLRRETPPGPLPDRRCVAIETGIRCWGETRVRLAALALAIAASEERRGETTIDFSVVYDDQVIEQDFAEREGLTRHLEMLPPSVHPGRGVARWFETVYESAKETNSVIAEPMVLISADADADPNFRDAIRDVPRPFLIATVDRHGNAVLSRRTALGDEVLQRLRLELPAKRGAEKGRTGEAHADDVEPLFLSQKPVPIRFNVDQQVTWCAPWRNARNQLSVWLVTRDRRLLLADWAARGAIEVLNDLPHCHVLAYQAGAEQLDLVLGDPTGTHELLSVDTHTHRCRRFTLPEDFMPTHTSIVGESVLRFSSSEHQEIAVNTGQVLIDRSAQYRVVGPATVIDERGRLLRHGGQNRGDWHSLLEANSSVIEPIECVVTNPAGHVCFVARDLSYLVELGDQEKTTYTNAIVHASGPPRAVLHDPTRQHWIVRYDRVDAASNVGRFKDGVRYFRFNTMVGHVTAVASEEPIALLIALDRHTSELLQKRSVRKSFRAAQMTPRGLLLQSPGNKTHLLTLSEDPAHRRFVMKRCSENEVPEMVAFEQAAMQPRETKWKLRPARLNGGTVWVDSRGLIHLQRDDDSLELTLVIVDHHVAGWFSETGFFGPDFFSLYEDSPDGTSGPPETRVPSQVTKWLEQWSERT